MRLSKALASIPSLLRPIVGACAGVGLAAASWAGHWWGLVSFALLIGLLFVAFDLAEKALDA